MSRGVQRRQEMKVRFQGIALASKGRRSSGGLWPPEPAPSRTVGLAIPHPVARLQSRTPLHQAPQN